LRPPPEGDDRQRKRRDENPQLLSAGVVDDLELLPADAVRRV
jgi:hypothetical protein